MIFVGDIAIPYLGSIKLKNIPNEFKKKSWFGNLEGTLLHFNKELPRRKVVFNDIDALSALKKSLNFEAVALANNHIFDAGNLEITTSYLNLLNIKYLGAGKTINDAVSPLEIQTCIGENVILLNYCWVITRAKLAKSSNSGVSPYDKKYIENAISKIIKHKSNNRLIVFFHWNYELELYPQPLDRETSHMLIDLGVDIVIGAHSHRLQGFEYYKGKPILYGLGNFAFVQKVYWDRKLTFPSFTLDEYAFEVNMKDLSIMCHQFKYNIEKNTLTYIQTTPLLETENLKKISNFQNLDNKTYIDFFKKNRYQKKLLPVFYFKESLFIKNIKIYWVNIVRHNIMLIIKKII